MIYQPGHGNPVHPCSYQRYSLSAEKQSEVPVLKRSEGYLKFAVCNACGSVKHKNSDKKYKTVNNLIITEQEAFFPELTD